VSDSIYLDSTYLAANPTWHVEDSAWKARQILRMLARHKIQPSRVAEVGCGAGEILRQLSLELPDALFTGFDVSPHAIERAKTREGDRLHFIHLDVRESDQEFDLLLVMDVIEHVEDCFGFLRGIREKARYKILHIPLDLSVSTLVRNRLVPTRKSVGHIHYFTKDTALALLEDTGYQVKDWFYTPGYELAPKDILHRGMALIRSALTPVAADFAATVLGGCPLLVLAE
jgi:SAM-dependent methyltransferase